jgi:ATP-binding protein involved in chromosome partitioning
MIDAEEQVEKREECELAPKLASQPNEFNERKRAEAERDQRLKMKMSKIKHKIAVISGKGGVGKSTVTVNLATAFALQGHPNKVGVLDADIHGPCVPKMLGLKGQKLVGGPAGMIFPVADKHGIKVASIDFLLPSDEAPVIWRGPLKMRVIQQFLSDIAWGDLDFLFIDLPPGTGDEPLSVTQLIPDIDGVIIVTIPSEVSQAVVKKAVTFAKQLEIPIIGIIENMSGFVCPECGAEINIFKAGGGKKIAKELSIEYLGKIPIDPSVCVDSDRGTPFVARGSVSTTVKAFAEIVAKIKQFLKDAK